MPLGTETQQIRPEQRHRDQIDYDKKMETLMQVRMGFDGSGYPALSRQSNGR